MGAPPGRTSADRWAPGDWNINCSICGWKMKAGEAVQNWQGNWRHTWCNEPRQPQDFVHALNIKEMQVPFVQKMGEADIQICLLNGITALPGWAIPGCMLPGRSGPLAEGLPERAIIED